MANLGSLYYQIGADTSGLRRAERDVKSSTDRMSSAFAGIGKKLAAAGGVIAVMNTIRSTIQDVTSGSVMELKRLDLAFTSIMGSAAKSGVEMQWLRQTADKLGVDLIALAEGYKTIAAAAKETVLEGKPVREIFLAITEEGTRLSLTNEQIQGSLYAVSQMISKGVVSMEELRQQLGERLPGAYQKAARAMGVTTQELGKMVESGTLLAEDFLPKFARELRRSGDSAESAQAPFARLGNAWRELKVELEKGIIAEIVIKGAEVLTVVLKSIKEFKQETGKAIEKTDVAMAQSEWAERLKIFQQTLVKEGYFDTMNIFKMEEALRKAGEAAFGTLKYVDSLNKAFGRFKELESSSTGVSGGFDVGIKERTKAEQEYWNNWYKGMAKAAAKMRGDLIPATQEYLNELGKLQQMRDAGVSMGGISEEEFERAKKLLDIKYKLEPDIGIKQQELQLEDSITKQKEIQAQYSDKMYQGASQHLRDLADWVAEYHGLNKEVFAALIKAESQWDPTARSPAGARGLTQLMPGTAKDLGVTNITDAYQNLMGGAEYLKQMLVKFNGDLELALAAYNAGPGRVQAAGGIPAIAETQKHVAKIMGMLGEDTASQKLVKTTEIAIQALEQRRKKMEEIRDLDLKTAMTEEELAQKQLYWKDEFQKLDNEILATKKESAEEQKRIVREQINMEVSALDQMLQSTRLTVVEREAIYEKYLEKRKIQINLETEEMRKAGIEQNTIEKYKTQQLEAEAQKRLQMNIGGITDLASVNRQYAELTGSMRDVYLAEMEVIKAAWLEKQAHADKALPEVTEAYRRLYEEQMRVAQIMADGTFAQGFIEGLRQVAKELKTVGQLGMEVAKEIASEFGNFLADIATGTKNIKDAWNDLVKSLISNIGKLMADQAVKELLSLFTGKGQGASSGLSGFLGQIFGKQSGTSVASTILGGTTGAVGTMNVTAGVVNIAGGNAMESLMGGTKTEGGGFFSGIKDWFSNIFKSMKDVFSNIFNVISEMLSSIFSGLSSMMSGLFSSIGNIFAGLFHSGGISGHPSAFRSVSAAAFVGAPRFHDGLAPGEYPSILKDDEAVVPLSGGRKIPVDLRGGMTNVAQQVNIQVITKDPDTRIKYIPSRSQQRAALVKVSKRGMADI